MKNFRMAAAAFVIAASSLQACSCEPLVPNPDGGMTGGGAGGGMTGGGGGAGGGMAGGGAGGGDGMTGGGAGGGDGMTGGGAGGGMTGGGAGGGMTGGGGGNPVVQFTEFARGLIVNETTATATPRPAADFTGLPDDAPITFSPGFFDGGVN